MFSDAEIKLYRNIIIAFVAVIAVILIIFLGIIPLIGYMQKPAFLDILVVPSNAKIEIDGIEYSNAIYEMEPRTYTAKISKDGFTDKIVELDLRKNQTTNLYLYLKPSDGNWSEFEKIKNRYSLENLLKINGYDENANKVENGLMPIDGDDSANEFIRKIEIKSIMPTEVSICGTPANRVNCDALEANYDYDEKCNYELCVILFGRTRELGSEIFNKLKSEISNKGYNIDNYKYIYNYDDLL